MLLETGAGGQIAVAIEREVCFHRHRGVPAGGSFALPALSGAPRLSKQIQPPATLILGLRLKESYAIPLSRSISAPTIKDLCLFRCHDQFPPPRSKSRTLSLVEQ